MHKRNVALIAAAWAAVVTAGIQWVPLLRESEWVGLLHLPAIFLAVVLSDRIYGPSHTPDEKVGWSAFVAYAVLYCLVFVIVYAIALEFYLLRGEMAKLPALAGGEGGRDGDPEAVLHHLGQAVARVEQRRRRHWVLDDLSDLDLEAPAASIASQALQHYEGHRTLRVLTGRLQRSLEASVGTEAAEALMKNLRARRDAA